MRILVIGPFGPGLLAESYARALEPGGHDVFRFDSDKAYFEASRYAGNRWFRRLLRCTLWNRLNLTTLEVVRAVRPSLVIAFKAAYLNPETIRRVRVGEGLPFVNYYPDNPYCGVPFDPRKTSAQRRDIVECLREYTRVFTWERGLVNRLTADRVSAVYLPFGVDTDCYRPGEVALCRQCGRQHEVVFVGQHNLKRECHINAIRRHEVGLWGARWTRAARRFHNQHVVHQNPVVGSTCAALYSAAQVSLNIVDDLNMPGHNMRTFEIPGSGGVMLASYTKEQAEFFPEDDAAVYYRDSSELDAKIDRIISNAEFRARIRHQALEASSRHSYTERVAELLASCGFRRQGG